MPNEFIVKNGLVVGGNVVTSGTITINGALAATQSWVTSQAYLTSASLSGYATQSYVTSALAALVDAAPAALDTLNELAAALGDDANFSTTITNSIASKLSLTGGTLTGALNGTSASFSSNVTLGNNADLVFVDLAGTFPTTGKGFDWTLNNDGARIYAVQPGSDSIDLVFQLRDNATTNDRFVFWVDEWQGPAYDKYPLIISGGTEFDLKDSSLYTNTVLRLSNSGVLQNVTGNISMFTNNAGYLTSYTETDTLATVTGRGATTSTNISVNTVILGTDATYGGAYRSVSFGYNGDSYNRILAANNTSDGMYFMAATGQGFNFRPNGGTANLVVINSAGNLGIGTTTPLYKLDVVGAIRSNASNVGTLNLGTDSYSSTYLTAQVIGQTSPSYTSTGKLSFKVLTWGAGSDYGPTEQMYIDVTGPDTKTATLVMLPWGGNVGIGTTSPSQKLNIEGNILLNLGGTLYLRDTTTYINEGSGLNLVSGATRSINLSAGGSERMRITATGYVGIGTTAPSTKLEVGNFLDAVTNKITVAARYEYEPEFNFRLGQSGTNYDWVGAVISSGDDGNYNGKILFKTANAGRDTPTTKMAIKANGNVGIGTVSPSEKLDVLGNIKIYNETGLITDYGPLIGRYNTSQIYIGTGGSYSIIKIGRDDGAALNVLSGGTIGIGTTSPVATLSVVGTVNLGAQASGFYNTNSVLHIAKSGVAQITFEDYQVTAGIAVAASVMSFGNQVSDATYRFKYNNVYNGNFASTGTTLVQFNPTTSYISAGNFGIGTTTPQKKLDVNGNGIVASFGTTISPGQFAGIHFGYSESASNNDSYKKSALVFERTDNHGQGGNASGKIHFLLNNIASASATSLSHSVMVIDTDSVATQGSARVGIGTTSPSSALEVIGTIRNKNASPNSNYSQLSTTEATLTLSTYSINTASYPANIIFSPASTEAMRINTAGKVSIGTTDTNSDKSDFTVYTGSGASLALVDDQVRMGGTDVNWGVALRSTGYLETYGQALYLQSLAGNHPVVVRPNNTSSVEFYQDYTLFNGLNLSISRINSAHAANYFRGDTSHLVIGTGGTLYLNYGGNTTNITGNTTNSGWLGVTGIVSANARKLSLGILDLNSGITPAQYKIKTNIPWNYGGSDFTVNIKGFRYGVGQMVSLSIGWHYYNNEFYNRNAISNGAWAPTISLAKSPDGYVIIYIPGPDYWPKLYVESVYSSNSADSYTSGWSWSDANLSDCTLIQTVPYNALATNISGNAATATSATTAGALSSMNISQFTNNSGYITGYTETDTLASVTGRGATTSTPITVTGTEGREVAVYIPSSYTTDDLVSGHEYGWYSDHWRLGMTRSGGAAGADFVVQWNASRRLSLTSSGNLTATGTITATGGNSSQWNTAYGWGNHASASYATTSYVTTQINNLVNGAPGALDTLNELATALGNDASFSTTVTNSIAGKVSKAGDTMTSSGQQVLNVYHGAATGDFNDALFLKSIASGQQVQIGMATLDADGDHHRVSLRAYKGTQTLEGVFGIALRQPGSAAHTQRLTLDYLGNLTIGGFLTESSSLKLKENVKTSEGNLEKVVNLRPVTYNKIGSQTTELGLIAEEVAEVYPEFVQYDENGEPIGVNYSRLTAALIGAVKELTQRIETLENNG